MYERSGLVTLCRKKLVYIMPVPWLHLDMIGYPGDLILHIDKSVSS